MSAGDLAKNWNQYDIVAAYNAKKNGPGGFNKGGEESVRSDDSEFSNYTDQPYRNARTIAQAYMENPDVKNEVDYLASAFINGTSRAAEDWKPMNEGGFA